MNAMKHFAIRRLFGALAPLLLLSTALTMPQVGAAEEPLRILILGDSYSAGTGAGSY